MRDNSEAARMAVELCHRETGARPAVRRRLRVLANPDIVLRMSCSSSRSLRLSTAPLGGLLLLRPARR